LYRQKYYILLPFLPRAPAPNSFILLPELPILSSFL
jgi:hypothetical protein